MAMMAPRGGRARKREREISLSACSKYRLAFRETIFNRLLRDNTDLIDKTVGINMSPLLF